MVSLSADQGVFLLLVYAWSIKFVCLWIESLRNKSALKKYRLICCHYPQKRFEMGSYFKV
jgi:hypothetical protein